VTTRRGVLKLRGLRGSRRIPRRKAGEERTKQVQELPREMRTICVQGVEYTVAVAQCPASIECSDLGGERRPNSPHKRG
jgi:hypothetical protein